jgi:hypothetical protein
MNSSLQRTCAARGRLLHRSKNLVLTDVPQKYGPVMLFDEEQKFNPRWLVVDTRKVNGKNNGNTFSQSINLFKRTAQLGWPDVRDYKRAAWANASG